MQEFFIKKGSVNPVLEMELIKDGRFDYDKDLINNALQDSQITFNMKNCTNGVMKIINGKASIALIEKESCQEEYLIRYKWSERDVNTPGKYEGWFEIKFNGDIYEKDVDFPIGNLIIPIQEELIIYIN